MTNKSNDINWVEIVDLLAHEYGWTIRYIETLSLNKIFLLVKQIKRRYKSQNQTGNSDTVQSDSPEKVDSDFNPTNEAAVRGVCMAMGGKIIKKEDGSEEIVI